MLLLGGETPQFLKAGTRVVETALPNCRVTVMAGQAHGAGGVPGAGAEILAKEVTRFIDLSEKEVRAVVSSQ